jgi:hypothetical protein
MNRICLFGFKSEERPQCALCLKFLAGDSMKPNKLKRQLGRKHSELKKKYFLRKFDENLIQQKSFVNTTTVSTKAMSTSYEVSQHRIALNKKPHMITETVTPLLRWIWCKQCSENNVLSNFVLYRYLGISVLLRI